MVAARLVAVSFLWLSTAWRRMFLLAELVVAWGGQLALRCRLPPQHRRLVLPPARPPLDKDGPILAPVPAVELVSRHRRVSVACLSSEEKQLEVIDID